MRHPAAAALALLAAACAVGTEPVRDGGPISGNTDLGARDRPTGFDPPDVVDPDVVDIDAPEEIDVADLSDILVLADAVAPDAPDVVDAPGCAGECAPGQTRACGSCGRQTCTERCAWGPCGSEGACAPGQTRACGRCGRETCTAACAWGGCAGEGVCAPGQVRAEGCDPCSQQVCGSACQWGGCQLRPGAACEYRAGRNNRGCSRCRCGLQWCLNTCQWSADCTSCCSTCGGCL